MTLTTTDLVRMAALAEGGGMIQKLEYDAEGKLIYQGFAKPTTATSTAKWLIKKLTYSGFNVTDIQYAEGEVEYQ